MAFRTETLCDVSRFCNDDSTNRETLSARIGRGGPSSRVDPTRTQMFKAFAALGEEDSWREEIKDRMAKLFSLMQFEGLEKKTVMMQYV